MFQHRDSYWVFASVKQIAFQKRNLQVRNEMSWALTVYLPFYFNAYWGGLGLMWGYWFVYLLIDPLHHFQHIHNGWSAKHKRLFWCTSKATKKRIAKPSAESTVVNEKKKSDKPTVCVQKFHHWKDTFPWVVHDANQDVMYCPICRRYPAVANLQSSLYIGCGSGGKYRIKYLVHHEAAIYCCSLQFEKDSNPAYFYALGVL